jgi:hypothetical protein
MTLISVSVFRGEVQVGLPGGEVSRVPRLTGSYGMAGIAPAAMAFGPEATLYGEPGRFSQSRRDKAESAEAPDTLRRCAPARWQEKSVEELVQAKARA